VTVARADGQDPAQHVAPAVLRQPDVQEAGPGDFGPRDQPVRIAEAVGELLGDLAGRAAQRLRELQCRVAREVAVVLLARHVERDRRHGGLGQPRVGQ
jgi:hypothetical protein